MYPTKQHVLYLSHALSTFAYPPIPANPTSTLVLIVCLWTPFEHRPFTQRDFSSSQLRFFFLRGCFLWRRWTSILGPWLRYQSVRATHVDHAGPTIRMYRPNIQDLPLYVYIV